MALHMPASSSVRDRFAELVGGSDETINLAEAALLIAAESYPGLDVSRYVTALDALAAEADPVLSGADTDPERVRRLVQFLAVERSFRGNQDDFYDRRNSFLNEVIERRKGIPITLAVVYMEVARRLGLVVLGVGFPGHFLAKYPGASELIIDPFFGQILSMRDCEQRLRAVLGAEATLEPGHLRAATPKEMLVRILRNLKQIYLQARELESALACSQRILLIEPDMAPELRDRGLLYEQLECYAAARPDLERFLSLMPDDPSSEAVRERLIAISRQRTTLH